MQKKYLCFITYFLSHRAFRNKFYFKKVRIKIQEEIIMDEGNYPLLYDTFLVFCCSQEQTLFSKIALSCI